ncbi:MAG: glycoside hydrolase family 52 protein, partial [Phycisphaerales bacterium]|nr:glycoside hydrolase family 52 protein [Phycisphaerales bacterium]
MTMTPPPSTSPSTLPSPSSPSPFFMTHHAPVGAWASLTFGQIGRGMSIEHESLVSSPNADLLVALHRDGVTTAFPFVEKSEQYRGWRFLDAGAMNRAVSPCIDAIAAEAEGGGGISLRVFSPHAALPNPKRSGNLQYATVPGVLMELSIDNSDFDSPATAFIGLKLHVTDTAGSGGGRLRPLDWSSKALCGVANSSKWALAAQNGGGGAKENVETGGVCTVLSDDIADSLASGHSQIIPNASTGGVLIKVPARSKRTVMLVFAFYDQGNATQGIDGRYLYTVYFPRVEAVANFILANSQKIFESCTSFDGRSAAACSDPQKLAVFSQAVRAYEANSQVIDAAGPSPSPYFTVIQGDAGYRNTLSLAVDHLPWELYRNPWVVRNIFDLATTSYAYQDRVRFSDAASPDELRDGGMTFAHDFGFHSCYATPSTSAAAFVTSTEDILNGVYLLTSYALLADDTPWAKTRLPFARELMINMENRDHWDPEKRTGIMKAQSDRVGTEGGGGGE